MRIGIVGTGSIARLHATQWRKLPVTLAAVYDIVPAASAAFAAEYGGTVCGSLDELLGQVDVVDVCTNTDAHCPVVLATLAAGVPTICEKPMARHQAECEAMIEASERTHTPLFIAQVVRFFPQFARAKSLLDEGALGKLGVIRTTRAGTFPRPGGDFSAAFYADFARSGGVIMDLGIHDIDFHRWCAGEVERVFARGLSFRGLPYMDHALLVLRFTSGAIGHIECSWAQPPGLFRTQLELAGDGGLLEWDSSAPAPLRWARRRSDDPTRSELGGASPLADADDPYCIEMAHFLDCLAHGAPCRVSPYDGYMAVKVALAAMESLRTGQPVEIAGFQEVLA